MEYNQKTLGKRIYKYREINRLSQKQLAIKVGISKSYITNLELGKGKTVGFEKVLNIANALNVSIDDLLCDSLDRLEGKPKNVSEIKQKILEEISTFSVEQIIQFNEIIKIFKDYKKRIEKEI